MSSPDETYNCRFCYKLLPTEEVCTCRGYLQHWKMQQEEAWR